MIHRQCHDDSNESSRLLLDAPVCINIKSVNIDPMESNRVMNKNGYNNDDNLIDSIKGIDCFLVRRMISYDTLIYACEVDVPIELCLNFNPIQTDCIDEMKINTILSGKLKQREKLFDLWQEECSTGEREREWYENK